MKRGIFFIITIVCMLSGVLTGCDSLDNSITSDPYGGGKAPLGIRLSTDAPSPSSGYPNDTIVFKASGLLKWCNPAKNEYQFKFYLGDQNAKIVTATDTTLTVVVPYECSSSVTYLVLQNQVFYGPNFPVLGNITVDTNYKLYADGADDAVYDCLEKYTSVPNYMMVGDFSYIGNLYHVGISYVDNLGNVATSYSKNFGVQRGLWSSILVSESPYISSISALKDGRMVVSGSFTSYESTNGKSSLDVNNIMVLKSNAVIDSVQKTFNVSNGTTKMEFSSFNGGTNTKITRSFVTSDDKIVAVGNFTQYLRTVYGDTYDSSTQTTVPVSNVFRADAEGNLDASYRSSGSSYTGAQGGVISDACMDDKDGIIIVGNFTSFDGVPVHGIVRLDENGNVDRTFLQKTGTGANGTISVIRYNKSLKKMMLTGSFTAFNGQARQGIVMLDEDGSVNETFKLKNMEGGAPNYAQLIDKQKVIISGSFTKYDGVPRPGFLILEMDGTAKQDYNVPGSFSGQLMQVVETETTVSSYGLLLLGDFTRFNGNPVHNVVMLEADFEH